MNQSQVSIPSYHLHEEAEWIIAIVVLEIPLIISWLVQRWGRTFHATEPHCMMRARSSGFSTHGISSRFLGRCNPSARLFQRSSLPIFVRCLMVCSALRFSWRETDQSIGVGWSRWCGSNRLEAPAHFHALQNQTLIALLLYWCSQRMLRHPIVSSVQS